MRKPEQQTLAVERALQQTFDSFVVGGNGELISRLRAPVAGFSGLWICGPRSSGRSHLLRAACQQAGGRRSHYIGCADFGSRQDGRLQALKQAAQSSSRVVAVDDVGALQDDAAAQEALLAVYQRLFEGGLLLVSHIQSAAHMTFSTPDLASRMRALDHYAITPLDDEQKADLLRRRADQRGYELTPAVLHYWLTRGPRDIGALLTDLDALDRATLTQQKLVTIPMLKQVLGY